MANAGYRSSVVAHLHSCLKRGLVMAMPDLTVDRNPSQSHMVFILITNYSQFSSQIHHQMRVGGCQWLYIHVLSYGVAWV